MDPKTICLLNDSFPPLIDGVANAVKNYAEQILAEGSRAMVITPAHPDAADSAFPYPVVRYPSINFRMMNGYMAGVPFSPEVARRVSEERVALIHSHCPIISNLMARELRQIVDAPLVMTYHTKFDVDIENIIKNKQLQNAAKYALVSNVEACDEVWAVSRGAGENLRSLGYQGDYIVMPNGVDIPRMRCSQQEIEAATAGYDLPAGLPVYLFVGRMMWYKGLRIILDALTGLARKADFRMVFIGGGGDYDEVKAYAELNGIADKCIFTGAIHNRDVLRAWYCRADLFLFPSTYDTNGLVVREAAACDLAAVLIKDSCAAEDVTDGRNGFLIEETPEALYSCLSGLLDQREYVHTVGRHAGEELYISWQTAVKLAMERYEVVIDRYRRGEYPEHSHPVEWGMKINGALMDTFARLSRLRHWDDFQ